MADWVEFEIPECQRHDMEMCMKEIRPRIRWRSTTKIGMNVTRQYKEKNFWIEKKKTVIKRELFVVRYENLWLNLIFATLFARFVSVEK